MHFDTMRFWDGSKEERAEEFKEVGRDAWEGEKLQEVKKAEEEEEAEKGGEVLWGMKGTHTYSLFTYYSRSSCLYKHHWVFYHGG